MKTTYTRTLFNPDLTKVQVKLYVYTMEKYNEAATTACTLKYDGITAWDIVEGGEEAAEIEADLNDDEMDAHHEYLVLHLVDGGTATFRNSCVDMFLR